MNVAPVRLSKRWTRPSAVALRAAAMAKRAVTPEPVGLRSIWASAKTQMLHDGSGQPVPPSVTMVP